jgi:hypothetical protein
MTSRRQAGLRLFFCEDVLEHGLVQAEVGHALPELAVLLLELPQLAHPHAVEPPLPAVDGGLADRELAADLLDRGAGLRLPQGESDLLVSGSGTLHGLGPRAIIASSISNAMDPLSG